MPSCALQCTIPACACAKMESVQAWVSRARDRYTRTGPSESGPDFFPVTLGMERQQGEDSMKRCWGWEKGGLGHEADFGGQLLHTLTKTLGAFCPSGPGLALSSLASLGRCRLGGGVGFIQRLPRAGSLLPCEYTPFSIYITQVESPCV